jgi:ketosteroid isomerase-like protein
MTCSRICQAKPRHPKAKIRRDLQQEGGTVSTYQGEERPEDLTRLFVERANAGDAEGIAAPYEEEAVMAYPPGSVTVGRQAIRELWEKVLEHAPHFEEESPLPTLISGDLALTSTIAKDGAGARAQVVRRQSDGTWQRLLDQPEFVSPQ